MRNQKGIAHLLLLLVVVGLIVVVVIYFWKSNLKVPGISVNKSQKQPTVTVKTSYKNPFKKDSQYVNPFDQYKSPFLTFQK